MIARLALAGALVLGALASGACSRHDETDCCAKIEPGPVCCAIAPRATCGSDLLGKGATQEEVDILLGPTERLCPSERLSEERLRYVASLIGEKCEGVLTPAEALRPLAAGICSPVVGGAAGVAEIDITPTDASPECAAGLRAAKLTPEELRIMLGPVNGVCPNGPVSEARIREIVDGVWRQAGCRAHTPAEMLHTLDDGGCGGDAG